MTTAIATRGGRFNVLALDLPSLAQAGTFLGGLGTLLVAILGALRGKQFMHWFVDRTTLIQQRDTAVRDLTAARSRERIQQSAMDTLQGTAEGLQTAVKVVQDDLGVMKAQQTAFLGYIHAMIVVVNTRDQVARDAGIDLSHIPLPDIPPDLRDMLS